MLAGNGGRRSSRSQVNGHDFPGPDVPRAYPYGIYDLGQEHRLRERRDRPRYRRVRGCVHSRVVAGRRPAALSQGPNAPDHGRWRRQQRLSPAAVEAGTAGLADSTGLAIRCVTFRPAPASGTRSSIGCSRSSPRTGAESRLRDYETIVRLIAETTTAKGLKVTCRLDRRRYPAGRKVSDEEYATVNLIHMHSMASGTTSYVQGALAYVKVIC